VKGKYSVNISILRPAGCRSVTAGERSGQVGVEHGQDYLLQCASSRRGGWRTPAKRGSVSNCRQDLTGHRIVSLPELGWETAPGDPNAPDAAEQATALA
jgi:hypothetical protein